MVLWRCHVCGYIWEGDTPPSICPKCGAGADEFEMMESMDDEEGEQPERSFFDDNESFKDEGV